MLKAIPGNSKKILVVSIVVLFLVSMVFFISPGKIYADSGWTWMNNSTPNQTSAVTWDVGVYPQATNYNGYKYEIFLTAAPYPVSPAPAPVIADKVAGTQEFTGVINSSSWGDTFTFYGIAAGDYIVNFIIRNSSDVEVTRYLGPVSFSCWDHTQGVVVDTANKTVTWNYTNSAGRSGQFWVEESGTSNYPYNFVIDPLVGDFTSITYSLAPGDYWAGMNINGNVSFQDFSIAAPASAPAAAAAAPAPVVYEKTIPGFVTLFYNRILDRAPDAEGFNGWVAGLISSALTGADLVNGFIFSEENKAITAGDTNEQFITSLYSLIFDRAPDPEGLAGWLANMSAGMTKEEVVRHFTSSTEFINLCTEYGVKP